MAFIKKTWKDRLSEFPKRWKLKLLSSSGANQSVELELDDGTVITQGDRFNAATMNDLEQRIEDAFNSSSAGVSSFNSRSGAVMPTSGDYSSNQISHLNTDTTETNVQDEINGLKANKVNDTQLRSAGNTGTDFYFDYQNGKYGWNESSARGSSTFHPFKQPVVDTKTITEKTTTDLGEDHTYRYIDTTGVANTNSGTYTFPSGDTGGTKDLGANNSYRYVNASNVYNKGKADGDVKHTVRIEIQPIRHSSSKNAQAYMRIFKDDTEIGNGYTSQVQDGWGDPTTWTYTI